ncbi:MAG: hypothetical protein JW954_05320 [Dehalococcoidaceae bacterium]|nr:hypothetical protein [Dehalococcoidaceae bacterium]
MKKKQLFFSLVLLAVFMIADIGFHLTHGDGWWADIAGFFALLGGLGCLAIILVAKVIGDFWLSRNEDYYDADRDS